MGRIFWIHFTGIVIAAAMMGGLFGSLLPIMQCVWPLAMVVGMIVGWCIEAIIRLLIGWPDRANTMEITSHVLSSAISGLGWLGGFVPATVFILPSQYTGGFIFWWPIIAVGGFIAFNVMLCDLVLRSQAFKHKPILINI